ncbi:hypothetical protein BRADI_1g43490v3 [Brachypodium distachyon]|uniref:Uncharacterized protein n=1 Tax=Brachypodium distachyon TaxID=15368 RepID=I1GZ07_BRADI|nr:hypothetical protein BRADI_1g43490v3 [Brachypodium distachyon]
MEGRNQANDHGNNAREGNSTRTTFPTSNLKDAVEQSVELSPPAEPKKMTLEGDSVLDDMEELSFDDYVQPLSDYLRLYYELHDLVRRDDRQPAPPPPAAAVTTVEMPPPPPPQPSGAAAASTSRMPPASAAAPARDDE